MVWCIISTCFQSDPKTTIEQFLMCRVSSFHRYGVLIPQLYANNASSVFTRRIWSPVRTCIRDNSDTCRQKWCIASVPSHYLPVCGQHKNLLLWFERYRYLVFFLFRLSWRVLSDPFYYTKATAGSTARLHSFYKDYEMYFLFN